jgi:hypothetical protein
MTEVSLAESVIRLLQQNLPTGDIERAGHPKPPEGGDRGYSAFFDVRADLAWVARSISGGGCCNPAIACQAPA